MPKTRLHGGSRLSRFGALDRKRPVDCVVRIDRSKIPERLEPWRRQLSDVDDSPLNTGS